MKTIIRKRVNSKGWGNGYVIIPEGHFLHGIDYDHIECYYIIDINHQVTFSEVITKELINSWPELSIEDEGSWMFGFHTDGTFDDAGICTKEYVIEQTKILARNLEWAYCEN